MKRNIIFISITLAIALCRGCYKTEKSEITAYYNGMEIYEHDVSAFVDMKSKLVQIYYNNAEDIEYSNPSKDDISRENFGAFINYSNAQYLKGQMETYISLSEEDKIEDYYISLVKYDYYVNEMENQEFFSQINEYNKEKILEEIKTQKNESDVINAINEISNTYNISVDECIEKIYLKAELDISFIEYKPTDFIADYYEGEVIETIDLDDIIALDTAEDPDKLLEQYWTQTKEYFIYLDKLNVQFYKYLQEKVAREVEFQ